MSVTINEIASRLNVSVMTVSRALNNKSEVKKKTRETVLKLAEELGYRPNIIAQSLVMKKSHTIGVIISDIRHSFFPDITFSIQNIFDKAGYSAILCNSNENEDAEEKQINMLLSRRVDGLIIAPVQNSTNLGKYIKLKDHKIPYIFIDRYLKDSNAFSIVCDDEGGAFKATEYLIKLGHRRIAFISGPPNTSTSDNRMSGFRKAMKKYKVPIGDNFLLYGGFQRQDGYAAAKKLTSQKQIPTAIFAVNDIVAMGIYDLLKKKSIRIPKDISVVGFANLELASIMSPPLTTVNQPKNELGKAAAEHILRMVEGEKYASQKKVLPTELVIRKSCKRRNMRGYR